MKDLTLKEQLIVKLIVYLVKFIGRHEAGFYSFELENIFKEEKGE